MPGADRAGQGPGCGQANNKKTAHRFPQGRDRIATRGHRVSQTAPRSRPTHFRFAPPTKEQQKRLSTQPQCLNNHTCAFPQTGRTGNSAVNDNLITVVGSPNPFNRKLAADLFAAKPIQLHRMLQTQSRSLSADDMAVAGQLKASALLRHVVTMVPDIKPEQVRNFPAGGDGAFAGLCIGQQRDIKATVRVSANEISALQRANRDGRKLLQDMLFQIFARQMMVTPQP